MTKPEVTNAELIAAVREWDEQLLASVGIRGVHPWMRKLADRLEAAEAELTRLREIVLSGTTPGDTGTIYLDPEKTLDQVWDALNGVPGSAAPVSLEAAKAEDHDHEFEDRCYCGVTAAEHFEEGDNRG